MSSATNGMDPSPRYGSAARLGWLDTGPGNFLDGRTCAAVRCGDITRGSGRFHDVVFNAETRTEPVVFGADEIVEPAFWQSVTRDQVARSAKNN